MASETGEVMERGAAQPARAPSGVGGEAPGPGRIELPVAGLTCGACVQAVE